MGRQDQLDFLGGEGLENSVRAVTIVQQRFQGSAAGIVTVREGLLPGGHVEPADPVVPLGRVGDRQEKVEGPGDDEDLLVGQTGAGIGEVLEGGGGLGRVLGRAPAGPGRSPFLGQGPELLDPLEDLLPVVVLHDPPQEGPHGADVGPEGSVLVENVGRGIGGGGVAVEEGSGLGKTRRQASKLLVVATAAFPRSRWRPSLERRPRRQGVRHTSRGDGSCRDRRRRRRRRRQNSAGRKPTGRQRGGSQHGVDGMNLVVVVE
mmetsp:Transcript_25731/g.60333  ORF Transcript_25731/g.60333 Transcript_25731/m.60333 type:complete len:261 (-) Transcript_25731:148-930(-)